MQGRLLAVAAIILFLAAGVPVVQQGYWESSTASAPQTTFGEDFTPTEGALITLSISNNNGVVYAPPKDITVTQPNSTIQPAGNWSWNQHNGTLKIAQNTSFDTGQSATVSGFWTVPEPSQNITKTLGVFPTETIGDVWQLAGGVLLLLGAIGILARGR